MINIPSTQAMSKRPASLTHPSKSVPNSDAQPTTSSACNTLSTGGASANQPKTPESYTLDLEGNLAVLRSASVLSSKMSKKQANDVLSRLKKRPFTTNTTDFDLNSELTW